MAKKVRLGLYLESDEMKQMIKIAAAKRGISATSYCAQAIDERLRKEGTVSEDEKNSRLKFLARVEKLRREIGPVGKTATELVKEGRRK